MELTANDAEAYLVDGELILKKKEKKKEKDVYIKYKDKHISCIYILDIWNYMYKQIGDSIMKL